MGVVVEFLAIVGTVERRLSLSSTTIRSHFQNCIRVALMILHMPYALR